jgi:HSP20 family protein
MNTIKYRNLVAPSIAAKAFFDDAFSGNLLKENTSKPNGVPLVNIKESNERFTVDLAIPGLNKSDIKLEVIENRLTISAEHKAELNQENEKFTRREFSYSAFSRSFSLPEIVDAEEISATYEQGILSVVLPKRQQVLKNKTRQIQVV